MKSVELGTDGACSGNPGPGGWGFLTEDGRLTGHGGNPHTTNQRMEVMAVARGLLAIFRDAAYGDFEKVTVVSDSRYVVDCFQKKWHVGWEKRGWKTASGSPVKHQKLWETLVRIVRAFEARGTKVEFTWVKGHAGHPLNEGADRLAVKGKEEAKAAKKITGGA